MQLINVNKCSVVLALWGQINKFTYSEHITDLKSLLVGIVETQCCIFTTDMICPNSSVDNTNLWLDRVGGQSIATTYPVEFRK